MAVKILTTISLIYLPITVVLVSEIWARLNNRRGLILYQNFFSTEFVQTSDSGHMQVSTSAWLLAVISLPLTVLTIGCWRLWVTLRLRRLKNTPAVSLTGQAVGKLGLRDRLHFLRFCSKGSNEHSLESGSTNGPAGCASSSLSNEAHSIPPQGWFGSSKVG